MLSVTLTIFPVFQKEQSVVFYLPWALAFRNWGEIQMEQEEAWPACVSPPLPRNWERMDDRVGHSRSLWTELASGRVSGEGEKSKKHWVVLEKVEQYICGIAIATLPHHPYPLLQKLERQKPRRKNWGTQLLAGIITLQFLTTTSTQYKVKSLQYAPNWTKPPWECRKCSQGWDFFCMYVHMHSCTHTLLSSTVTSIFLPEPGVLRWLRSRSSCLFFFLTKKEKLGGKRLTKTWRMGAAISNTIIDKPSHKLPQTNNFGPDPEAKCLPTHSDTTQNTHCTAYCVWSHRNSLSHTMIGTIHHKLETCPLFQSCTLGLKSNVTIFIITTAKVFGRRNYLCR